MTERGPQTPYRHWESDGGFLPEIMSDIQLREVIERGYNGDETERASVIATLTSRIPNEIRNTEKRTRSFKLGSIPVGVFSPKRQPGKDINGFDYLFRGWRTAWNANCPAMITDGSLVVFATSSEGMKRVQADVNNDLHGAWGVNRDWKNGEPVKDSTRIIVSKAEPFLLPDTTFRFMDGGLLPLVTGRRGETAMKSGLVPLDTQRPLVLAHLQPNYNVSHDSRLQVPGKLGETYMELNWKETLQHFKGMEPEYLWPITGELYYQLKLQAEEGKTLEEINLEDMVAIGGDTHESTSKLLGFGNLPEEEALHYAGLTAEQLTDINDKRLQTSLSALREFIEVSFNYATYMYRKSANELGLKWKRVYGIYGENAYTYIPDVHTMAKRRGIDLDPNLVPPLMSQKGIFEQFGSVVNSYLRLKTEATLNGFMVREDGRNGRPVAKTYNGFVQFSQNSSRPELEGLAGRKAKKIKDLWGRLVTDPISQARFTLITNDEV